MNKQIAPNFSNRTSELQRKNNEEPEPDRKAMIRNMVLKNSKNSVIFPKEA